VLRPPAVSFFKTRLQLNNFEIAGLRTSLFGCGFGDPREGHQYFLRPYFSANRILSLPGRDVMYAFHPGHQFACHLQSQPKTKKTWVYCHTSLGTRNSHSCVLPSEFLLSMWPCPKSFGSFENGMRIGKIITSVWKGPGKYLSIDFLNATHTSALFLLAQFMNFLSIESNLVHQDLVHFIARETEIPHGGRWAGMVEPLGQNLEADSILGPLDEPERLP
jgi:hypothetical protein